MMKQKRHLINKKQYKKLIKKEESGTKGVYPRITGTNKHRMVVVYLSIIREVASGPPFGAL